MLGRLLKNSDWAKATEYLSPDFFQVVPALAMGKRIAVLASSYADRRAFARVCAARAAAIAPLGVTLDLEAELQDDDEPLAPNLEVRILRLYFTQILRSDTVLLDLRRSAFAAAPGGGLLWKPKPLYATFDPSFALAIRAMYRGFYESRWALFDDALEALGLFQARDLFLDHFGGSQAAMRFDLAAFRKTFHEVFVRCKAHGSRLHPDFLAFGAGLFGLYEHLERGERAFDVRAAFRDCAAQGEDGAWRDLRPSQ